MPSGWTRWLLEQYEFPFEVVFPQTLDAGNLNEKFDVLMFVDGAHPDARRATGGGGSAAQPRRRIPAEFRDWLGTRHRREDRAGAEEVRRGRRHGARRSDRRPRSAITSACRSATRWSSAAPTARARRCRARSSTSPARSSRRASTPRIRSPTAWPSARCVLRREPGVPAAAGRGARRASKPVAWFDIATPLRSGWAWGQQYLDQAVADRRRAGRQGTRRAVRAGGRLARAAARHVQVPVQRHLSALRRAGRAGRAGQIGPRPGLPPPRPSPTCPPAPPARPARFFVRDRSVRNPRFCCGALCRRQHDRFATRSRPRPSNLSAC